MKKLMLLIAGGVGYVLGARAGRERYDQIKRTATRVKDDPRVQEKTHEAVDLAKTTAQQAADLAKEKAPAATAKISEVAETVVSKVKPSSTND